MSYEDKFANKASPNYRIAQCPVGLTDEDEFIYSNGNMCYNGLIHNLSPVLTQRKALLMEYIPAKTIVTKTKTRAWFGTEYNMNIYRGCCHGCIYCDSRSDCYQVKDFDQVKAKKDALLIIRALA